MVAPDPVNTRLQSRVDAHEEKIEFLANQVKDLSVSINSMKEILSELPKSIEKITMGYQKQQEKQFVYDEEGEASGFKGPEMESFDSGEKIPNKGLESFIRHNHFETSLFSMPKVKLPLFEGVDPRGWITKAELYFQVHQTPSSQKLKLTQMCMDGSALNWFTNLLIKHPNTTWDQFRDKLMVRFGGTKFHNAHEALGSLYQEGDIDDYIESFEALSALIPDQSEAQSTGMFLRGLQIDIKNWVRALHPVTCDQAMDLARHVATAMTIHGDKTNTRGKTSFNNGTGGHNYSWKYTQQDSGQRVEKPNTLNSTYYQSDRAYAPTVQAHPKPYDTSKTNTPIHRHPGTRHLTKQEWEDRRKRGLCFSCGQKYSPQHKCTEGQLRVILLTDGEELGEDGEIRCIEEQFDGGLALDGECNALEFYGFASNSSPTLKTLKLAGELRGISALFLVDSGATHNFLSKQLAVALGLEIKLTNPLSISFGGGKLVRISEMCHGVSIKLGPFNCVVDALVYDLGSLDMILGIAWLGTLGDVVFNWKTQQMRFWQQGILIQLQGVSSSPYNQSSINTLLTELGLLSADIDAPTAPIDDHQPQFNATWLQLIEYAVGHIIDSYRVSMKPSKILVVQDWPDPKNTNSIQRIFNSIGYYTKFIKDHGNMVALKKLLGRMQLPFKLSSLISGLRTSLLLKTVALIENGPIAQAHVWMISPGLWTVYYHRRKRGHV